MGGLLVYYFCLIFAGGSGKVHSSADRITEISQCMMTHTLTSLSILLLYMHTAFITSCNVSVKYALLLLDVHSYSPCLRSWSCRWLYVAWRVWCQTYGHLPGCRELPQSSQLCCLLTTSGLLPCMCVYVAVGLVGGGGSPPPGSWLYSVTCRLTAKYGFSSVPKHSTYEYGTTFTFIDTGRCVNNLPRVPVWNELAKIWTCDLLIADTTS